MPLSRCRRSSWARPTPCLSAAEQVAGHGGDLLVLVGDNPYITAGELQKLIASHRQDRAQCTFISAVFPGPPPPYGRVVRDGQGRVQGIVEEKDASPEQRQIREVNASIYLFDNRIVFPLLAQIGNDNAKKEYYLTDIIAILRRENLEVEAVQADDCDIAIGINDRRDLQAGARKIQSPDPAAADARGRGDHPAARDRDHRARRGDRPRHGHLSLHLPGRRHAHRQKLRDRPLRLSEKRPRQRWRNGLDFEKKEG